MNEFPVSSRIICLQARKTNYNEFAHWQWLVLSLLIKYVYFRYESNFPLGPESSSRTGISLSVDAAKFGLVEQYNSVFCTWRSHECALLFILTWILIKNINLIFPVSISRIRSFCFVHHCYVRWPFFIYFYFPCFKIHTIFLCSAYVKFFIEI